MALYISLLTFTQKGVEAVKHQASRMDAIKQAYKAAGGELIAYYATMGQYDGVVVYRMPDDVAAASFILSTMSMGNVRSETMRAFGEDEYRQILENL
ncbi:MAG: GYD domain-containing protein [Vicinamibacteria bacterium]